MPSMPSLQVIQEAVPNTLDMQPQKVFHVGDSVRIFSNSINSWVDGKVSAMAENDCVMVQYVVGESWYTKMLHKQSHELAMPSSVNLTNAGPNTPLVASASFPFLSYQMVAAGLAAADSDLLSRAKSFKGSELPKKPNSRSAVTLMNEGTLLSVQEDYAGAMEKFIEAEKLYQETRATRTPGYAVLFKHMGDCSFKMGDLRFAMEQYERAKSLYEASHATRTQDYPTLLESMGSLVRKNGDLEKAMNLYKKAERALEAADLNETPDYKRVIEAIDEIRSLQEVPTLEEISPRRTRGTQQ